MIDYANLLISIYAILLGLRSHDYRIAAIGFLAMVYILCEIRHNRRRNRKLTNLSARF